MANSLALNQDMVAIHASLESVFRTGAIKYKEGMDQMAMALLRIQKGGYWRVATSHENELFGTFDEYVRWLADDARLSRSTLYAHKGAIRFALVNGYASDEDDFSNRGGVLTFGRIKKVAVTNRDAEVIGIRGHDAENPKDVIQEIVDVIDPEARPRDQVQLIKEVIEGSQNVVDIFFRLRSSTGEGYDLIWFKESNVGHEEGMVRDHVPEDVLTELKSKFHILGDI